MKVLVSFVNRRVYSHDMDRKSKKKNIKENLNTRICQEDCIAKHK